MRLGMHTYSLYHHGVAEDWAGFKLPWERQMTLFEMMDYIKTLGLEGLHLDAKALDRTENAYFDQVRQYARDQDLYLEFNFALKSGQYDSAVQFEISDGLAIAHAIGADITKIGMNLTRPPAGGRRQISPGCHGSAGSGGKQGQVSAGSGGKNRDKTGPGESYGCIFRGSIVGPGSDRPSSGGGMH